MYRSENWFIIFVSFFFRFSYSIRKLASRVSRLSEKRWSASRDCYDIQNIKRKQDVQIYIGADCAGSYYTRIAGST